MIMPTPILDEGEYVPAGENEKGCARDAGPHEEDVAARRIDGLGIGMFLVRQECCPSVVSREIEQPQGHGQQRNAE